MKTVLIICAALFLVLPCMALAVDCPIPDTGQTICYAFFGFEIPCPQPGEPFYGQDAQYIINPQSYTKLDASGNELPDNAPWPWAMVRDNVTGLIWEVKTDDGTIHDDNILYTWERAMDFSTTLNSQNFGGYSDWRLPSVKELLRIVKRSTYPRINVSYFPNTMPYKYWASPVTVDIPFYKWVIYFSTGAVSSTSSNTGHVRAVRGEQSTNIFLDNNDGTVTDTHTGFMWQKDTAPANYNWQQALSYCENLTLAGYDDWRLPDINELQSIIDYSRYNPAIDTTYFSNTLSADYWSSTPDPLENQGWGFGLDDGGMSMLGMTASYYVRAVRGGQCGSFYDLDCDTIPNGNDNCLHIANLNQSDLYPPQGNGIGDACDCEGNFNCSIDQDVDGSDAALFKADFGRSLIENPCANDSPCNGDFNCDHDCDGTDASLFKSDFGRSAIQNPCPLCVVGEWCVEYVNTCTTNMDCPLDSYCEKPIGQCEIVGECTDRPVACLTIYLPVCGCDGITYSNDSYAAAAGISIDYLGECV